MEGAFPSPSRQLTSRRRLIVVRCLSGLAATAFLGASCSHQYRGTTAANHLQHIRNDPDANVRFAAYSKLAAPSCYDTPEQKTEAVTALLDKLEHGKEPVATRAVIIRTLGVLGDPSARDAIVKAVSDPEAIVRVQACRALGKVGRQEDATLLTRVMTTDVLEDCRIAAIESIGALKPADPRISQVLVTGMQHDDPATRLASLNALRTITGRDLGVDPVPWQQMLQPKTLLAAPTSPAPSDTKPTADPEAKPAINGINTGQVATKPR